MKLKYSVFYYLYHIYYNYTINNPVQFYTLVPKITVFYSIVHYITYFQTIYIYYNNIRIVHACAISLTFTLKI